VVGGLGFLRGLFSDLLRDGVWVGVRVRVRVG